MSEQPSSKQHRAIEAANERNEFVTDVDGFVYWWPDGTSHGHHSAEGLRALADELDRLNEKWQAEIDREFGPKPVATVINNNQSGWTKEPQFRIEPTRCECHPETCCCPEWTVFFGERLVARFSDRESLRLLVDAANGLPSTKPAGYTWTPDAQGALDGPAVEPSAAHSADHLTDETNT